MTGLLYYLKGTILVKLLSNTPERFLNICNANNIFLWDLYYDNENYYFKISPNDYFKIKKILKKTASKTIIMKKTGLPFVMFMYRKHYCFLIGIGLAIMLLYTSSLFVWDISIEGNTMLTDDVLTDFLELQGIRHGMFINNISCNDIEKFLRNEYNDLTWVSAEINGTRLIIHVKENDEDYVEINNQEVCDLKATKDGVVVSIITRSGTPLVKEGDVVKAGDILVSGIVNVYDDYATVISKKFVRADADIFIKTVYNYEDVLKMKYTYKLYTGSQKEYAYIKIMNYQFKFGLEHGYENYEQITSDEQLRLNTNFFLPIHYGKIVCKEYGEEYADYTKEEGEKILSEHLNYFFEDMKEKGVQIIQNDVKMYNTGSEYTYKGTIEMIEPAYTQSEIAESEYMGEVSINERN